MEAKGKAPKPQQLRKTDRVISKQPIRGRCYEGCWAGGGKEMNKKGYLCDMQLASTGLTYKGLPFHGGYSLTCDLEKNAHSKNP